MGEPYKITSNKAALIITEILEVNNTTTKPPPCCVEADK